MPRRREAGHVRHLATGHEAETGAGRELQEHSGAGLNHPVLAFEPGLQKPYRNLLARVAACGAGRDGDDGERGI